MSTPTIHDQRTDTEPSVGPGTGTALATTGLGLAALGPVLVVVGTPEALPYVVPFALLPAVGAFLVWRFGTWSKVLSIILGGLLLFMMVGTPAGEGLRYPASFFDFVPSTMFLVGALAAIAGGAIAIWTRRGRRSLVGGRESAIVRSLVAGIVTVGIGSAVASVATNQTVDEADRAGAVEIAAAEGDFSLTRLPLASGQTTRVLLRNEDPVVHTFTSDTLGVDQILRPGDEVLVELTPSTSGTYQFWCQPHSGEAGNGIRDGMVGTLEIS